MIRKEAKIIGVAIMKKSTGEVISLPAPNRHADVIYSLPRGTWKHSEYEQGFINEDNIFLTRRQARLVAVYNNQLIERAGNLSELFSEDVW